MDIDEFRQTVWDYYHDHGRDLPWRHAEVGGSHDPYKILVSEIMLQQTQAARVISKYHSFLERFPDLRTLAKAPLAVVLSEWSGLGYNRRAKYLHEAAKQLANTKQPWQLKDLTSCKGIGTNTAAAVLVYAYNQPLVFIETNIRTVFIYHFFHDRTDVDDKELLPLVEAALDAEHPREFYWALMDYGVHLKAVHGNASRLSKHYARQSAFVGSKRQVRGQILRLLKDTDQTYEQLATKITDERLADVLSDLVHEELVSEQKGTLRLG